MRPHPPPKPPPRRLRSPTPACAAGPLSGPSSGPVVTTVRTLGWSELFPASDSRGCESRRCGQGSSSRPTPAKPQAVWACLVAGRPRPKTPAEPGLQKSLRGSRCAGHQPAGTDPGTPPRPPPRLWAAREQVGIRTRTAEVRRATSVHHFRGLAEASEPLSYSRKWTWGWRQPPAAWR